MGLSLGHDMYPVLHCLAWCYLMCNVVLHFWAMLNLPAPPFHILHKLCNFAIPCLRQETGFTFAYRLSVAVVGFLGIAAEWYAKICSTTVVGNFGSAFQLTMAAKNLRCALLIKRPWHNLLMLFLDRFSRSIHFCHMLFRGYRCCSLAHC